LRPKPRFAERRAVSGQFQVEEARMLPGVSRSAACGMAVLAIAWSTPGQAQAFRVGYVDLGRVMWRSDLSQAAHERLRQQRVRLEAQRMASAAARGRAARSVEREALERQAIEAEMERRQIAELQRLHEAAVRAVRQIAQAEQLDAVLDEAAYIDPKHDLTPRVLALMRGAPKP
jgi:outer membrane protein